MPLGLVADADIRDGCVVRQAKAYPVYDDDYRHNVAMIRLELERERAQVELGQMREAMRQETVFSGDTSARRTVCPTCDKPVGSEKFCANCGTRLGTAHCTECGAELPTAARFCGNCGSKAG